MGAMHEIKPPANIIGWQTEEAIGFFNETMSKSGGYYWGRLGGSDYEAVARVATLPGKLGNARFLASKIFGDVKRVRALNGFYDLDMNRVSETYKRYVGTLDWAYESADSFFYANQTLIDQIENGNLSHSSQGRYTQRLIQGKPILHYGFIEGIHPFLKSFKEWGEGKKILVVSPISESLNFQYARKNELLVDYEFPDFELATVNSSITYNDKSDVREGRVLGNHDNWFAELDDLKSKIQKIDFDVALLSCGSYAGPLGAWVANELERKAVYFGGVLNVYFNIYGRRYDNDFVRSISRPETQIDAFEASIIQNLSGGRSLQNEALRAYFR